MMCSLGQQTTNRKPTMNKFDAVANLAHFLQEQKGSVLANWSGKMTAKQQREMFGVFMGKGLIVIDGEREIIQHLVKVCHWNGQDSDPTFYAKWNDIAEHAARIEANKGK
jgi:hypothetical protein